MKSSTIHAVFVVCLLCWTTPSMSQQNTQTQLPEKENFHLFLLAGQSNMAGRGKVAPEDQQPHPRVLALSKQGQWIPAVDPLHWDKSVAGVGLGRSFAITLADKNPKITIGLIPAACGGSPIETWVPGGYHGQTRSNPYDDAIARTRRAMQDGVLKGILWHQGESDCNADRAKLYRERLSELIHRFRTELQIPDLPFVIGQLGQFPQSPWNESKKLVNSAHAAIAESSVDVGFVSSEGLSCKSDNVHFDAASLREFGRRYAQVCQDLLQ